MPFSTCLLRSRSSLWSRRRLEKSSEMMQPSPSRAAWIVAYRHTPHGKPMELK